MSLQNKNLIDNSKSTNHKYNMQTLGHMHEMDDTERDQLNASKSSKSNESKPLFVDHMESSPHTFDHFRPSKPIPNMDAYDEEDEDEYNEEDYLNSAAYLSVKQKLKLERVSLSAIEYLETKLHQLPDINFDSAMMRILQYKVEQAHNGSIKNKGIHKTEAPPYAFYDDDQMELPKTKKFKLKLNEMNNKLYTENRIEWVDYVKLQEDDSVDYRNDQGKFVIAKVMEKDGVELVLYTKEGQTVMINFLNQYPYQRLFKMGAVTARIPKKIRRKSVEIGSQIRLLCDTDFIMNSEWTQMECKVVDRDIDHIDGIMEETDDIPKQIQIEFTSTLSPGLTHTNGSTEHDENNNNNNNNNVKTHRMWVHLDNTKPDDVKNDNANSENEAENECEPIIIHPKPPHCGCVIL